MACVTLAREMLKQLKDPKKQLVLTFFIAPFLLWLGLFFSRPFTYSLSCAQDPSPCTIGSINSLDQAAFLVRSIKGDFYSNVVQNTIGVIAFLVPWLLFYRRKDEETALSDALSDTGILLSASIWNGAILEVVRLIVQRPRPMVYDSPLVEGLNPIHYTSFYSGHTSFVALATLSVFFMLKKKYPTNARLITFSLLNFAFWTCLTGFLRVYGGRHYPTDVLFGAFAGTLIVFFVSRYMEILKKKLSYSI